MDEPMEEYLHNKEIMNIIGDIQKARSKKMERASKK